MKQDKTFSFTYDDLTSNSEPAGLIEYAKGGRLDAATYERLAHLGRFCDRIAADGKDRPYLPIGLRLVESDLVRMWWETAAKADKESPARSFLEIFSLGALPWLAEFVG